MEEEEDNKNNGGSFEKEINTGRRSLCLKLKIPKLEANPTDEDKLLPFVCPVCEKRFKSGKALGGHKRMHNIITTANNNKKTKHHGYAKRGPSDDHDRDRDDDDDDDDEEEEEIEKEEEEVLCPLCSKVFRSKKSLFGHMRSHPERGWRGIHPPDDNDLPSWSVTAKRGRKSATSSVTGVATASTGESASSPSPVVVVPGMEESMKEAVLDLMLFAHHKPAVSFSFSFPPPPPPPAAADSSVDSDDDEDDKKKKKKTKRKRKMMKLVEEHFQSSSSSSKQKNKYVCSDCDKSFSSYQALGGHRSSHNKSHLYNNTNNNNPKPRVLDFDLNEPPPPEHDVDLE